MIFKKEKEVIKLIEKHIDKVEEVLNTTEKTLAAYLTGDKKEAKILSHRVDDEETQADFIYQTIRDKLYSGAYLPLIREDIYRLVESIDKVANASEASCDFFLNQRPTIPENLRPHFSEIVHKSLSIIGALKEAVLCFLEGVCPVEMSWQHAKNVGVIESEVDKLEWDLTKIIFTSSLDHSQKIHLKQCLNTIVEISDRAEDASEQLELVTLKSMF